MMTKEEAINYLHSTGMNDEQIKELTKALTHKPYERFLPCKCGCNRRSTWYGISCETGKEFIQLVCNKCGFSVHGKNGADAKREWNKQVRKENHHEVQVDSP